MSHRRVCLYWPTAQEDLAHHARERERGHWLQEFEAANHSASGRKKIDAKACSNFSFGFQSNISSHRMMPPTVSVGFSTKLTQSTTAQTYKNVLLIGNSKSCKASNQY